MELEIVYILTLSYAQFEEEYSCTVGFTTIYNQCESKKQEVREPKTPLFYW